jgi:hypothetical protein
MPGLVPGIHVSVLDFIAKTWMAGTSPAMTEEWTNITARLHRHSLHCRSRQMSESANSYPASLKRSAFGSKRERKISASSGSSKQ